MGLRTAEQYLESLRDGREVYYDGERVVDIVAHPVLGQSARHFARAFTLQADPRYENLATVEEDGERVSRFFVPPRNGDELRELGELGELGELVEAFSLEAQGADFHLVKFTAANALLALLMVGKRIDRELGTPYGERAEALLADFRRDDRTGALCMSDTKGDRSKKPQDQPDPDLYTRIVERRPRASARS